MYEGQHLMGLVEDSKVGDPVPDSNSCVSAEYNSSFAQSLQANPTAANLDPILFNDLVQIVPLVQTLIERKASSSFTRRGSMIYTKTPSVESLSKKITDSKGRNIAQSIHTRKKRDQGEKEQGKNGSNNLETDRCSVFASRALASENDREELVILKEQVEDLQRQLLEKDELLKSRNQMNAQLNELEQQASEKDSLLKSTQQQLKDAKIKLADKQAALERIQWEAMTSNKEVENLQEELNSVQGDISLFMLLLEGLKISDTAADCADNYDIKPYDLNLLPSIEDLDEMEMQKMEEARKAYIAAVAAAKEKQDEESVTAAANARLHLQSYVFKSKNLIL